MSAKLGWLKIEPKMRVANGHVVELRGKLRISANALIEKLIGDTKLAFFELGLESSYADDLQAAVSFTGANVP